MTSTKLIRILIADDFKALRDVIRLYLKRAGDMDVIDEALDMDDALESARILHPDVIILNNDLPPIDSAHAATVLRTDGIIAAILVISMGAESEVIQRSFESGVNGFMYKDEIDEFLLDGIRRVHQGERYLSPKAGDAYSSAQE